MDDDLTDAVHWAIAQGLADAGRIGILGGSYGGYAVLMALARHPNLYACGIDVVGPTNLETFVGEIPAYWEAVRPDLYRAVGDPSTPDGRHQLQERSPLYHAGSIRAPLLVVHGANDPRVKQAEAERIVAAVKLTGTPVTYLLYPDEGHGFRRAANRRSFFAAAECFLALHLGGGLEPLTSGDVEGSSVEVRDDAVGLDVLLPKGRIALGSLKQVDQNLYGDFPVKLN